MKSNISIGENLFKIHKSESICKVCVCIGVTLILTNTNNIKCFGKWEGVRKFVQEKLSYIFVHAQSD
jgi:hypothetical protein